MPFRNPIAGVGGTLIIDQLRSANYNGSDAGWQISRDGDADFQDLTIRGTAAVNALSASTINLAGTDLLDILDDSSIGVLLTARLAQQGSNPAITKTLTKVFELNCGTVKVGRTYRIRTEMLVGGSGTLALSDKATFTYRYTLDGTAPTTSSPQMDGGFDDNYYPMGHGNWLKVEPSGTLDVTVDAQMRIGLFAVLSSGAGTYAIYAGSTATSRPTMTLYDDGPSGSRNDAAISLTGGGITRFTKTFNAVWAWSVNGTNSYITQGNGGGGVVDRWGLVGFNVGSALAGAVTPVSLSVKWICRTRSTAPGLDTRIASHNYASKAEAEADIGWPEGGPTSYVTPIVNVSNAVPESTYTTSLGTSVFNQFKAGTKKGLAFLIQGASYTSSPDGTGTIYGYGTKQMQLVAVYDGTS